MNLPSITTKSGILAFVAKQIFTVTFLKADGSIRRLNGRVGNNSQVLGNGKSNHADHETLIVVWDCQNKAWKSFHADKVLFLTCYGLEFDIADLREFELKAIANKEKAIQGYVDDIDAICKKRNIVLRTSDDRISETIADIRKHESSENENNYIYFGKIGMLCLHPSGEFTAIGSEAIALRDAIQSKAFDFASQRRLFESAQNNQLVW